MVWDIYQTIKIFLVRCHNFRQKNLISFFFLKMLCQSTLKISERYSMNI